MDLFNERVEVEAKSKSRSKAELFEDYEGFVKKFEVKKTTDDCYTPNEVYQVVLDYVAAHVDAGTQVHQSPAQRYSPRKPNTKENRKEI